MSECRLVSERLAELLRKAAKTYGDGSDPFSGWWLCENDVTANECMILSGTIARLIAWFLSQSTKVQNDIQLSDEGDMGRVLAAVIHESNVMAALRTPNSDWGN